jgi:outer membrane protein TolC
MLPGVERATPLPRIESDPGERALPINLPTALRLAGARPLIITAAQARLQIAQAELGKANVLWLPSLNTGAGYYFHDGATQGQSGNYYNNNKNEFLAGGGFTAKVAATDAFYAPLAARQVVRSREIDIQSARNDAVQTAAEVYFFVQQARGRLAALRDVVDKNREMVKAIEAERAGTARPTDLHRARTQLARFEDDYATAREQWGLASADLNRVLRLNPSSIVAPIEPPNLRMTLISPQVPVDTLIPIGLTSRPELASQQALVQAALIRIKQERMRPLIPSLVLQGSPGSAGPGGYLMGGLFSSGVNGNANPTNGRVDVSVALVWEMQNLGLGNRAMVRESRAQEQQVLIELFRIQDMVAAEIVQAYTRVSSSNARIASSETGLREATLAYEGSLAELGKVERKGDVAIVVRRVFEVIDALKSLSAAYDTYFESINDYNRAQFRLYRSLGYPAESLIYDPALGPTMPVDTTRPPQMAPVCPPGNSSYPP